MSKWALGADHAGFGLKEALKTVLDAKGVTYHDFGTFLTERDDYPGYAGLVAQAIQKGDFDRGILVCGSGIGINIAANRFNGIRAVICHEAYSATMSRRHNDANIICFGGRVIAPEYAAELWEIFDTTAFEGGRHQARVAQIDALVPNEAISCQV